MCLADPSFVWGALCVSTRLGMHGAMVKNGIQECKVGYLPKYLAAGANRYNGHSAHIVKIYSGDHATCDNVAKRMLLGGNFGDVRHVHHVAI